MANEASKHSACQLGLAEKEECAGSRESSPVISDRFSYSTIRGHLSLLFYFQVANSISFNVGRRTLW